MKKIKVSLYLFVMIFALLISVQLANACSCLPINLNRVVEQSQYVFVGKVVEVISETKVKVDVVTNYSNPEELENTVIVTSINSEETSCGINFSGYENNTYLILGTKQENKDEISTGLCSFRRVIDNKVEHVYYNGDLYEEFDLTNFIIDTDSSYNENAIVNENEIVRENTLKRILIGFSLMTLVGLGGYSFYKISLKNK